MTGVFTRKIKGKSKVGTKTPSGAIIIRIDGKGYFAHHLAFLYMTGAFTDHFIVHRNGMLSDNRWIEICNSIKKSHRKRLSHSRHGWYKHPLYAVWTSVKSRCNNEKCNGYHNYGGRGITICNEWNDSPNLFIEWAITSGWALGLEIDRIDNEGNYNPSNCRFVTRSKNAKNRRSIKNRTGYRGVTITHSKRYQARVYVDGKTTSVGCYPTPKEAAVARDKYIQINNIDSILSIKTDVKQY